MATTEAEIAWAAGLFEGEGCISLLAAKSGSNRTQQWVRLTIAMTDRDVLEQFCRIIGTGGVGFAHRAQRANHKDCWHWQASARKDVQRILTEFLPWFGERRGAKAREALALISELRAPHRCEFCDAEFEPSKSDQRFCSNKHQMAAWHQANKESGRRSEKAREHYLNNREAYLERARRQRERLKA